MDLRVALIQTDLYWENATANLASMEEKIANITEQVDVIVLPEMFTTGFTMNPASVAEPMNLTTHLSSGRNMLGYGKGLAFFHTRGFIHVSYGNCYHGRRSEYRNTVVGHLNEQAERNGVFKVEQGRASNRK